MSIHASCGAIEALDGGGIGNVVAHHLQGLMDASPTAMSLVDLDGLELSALTMLNDLDMSQRSGNPIFGVRRTSYVI